MEQKRTEELLKRLKSTTKTEVLERYLDEIIPDSVSFPEYLAELLAQSGQKKSEVIAASGLQRTYAYQIFDGQKHPGRDKVLALSLAMGLELSSTQRLLTLAGAAVLYPKKSQDAVLIFALQKHLSVMETQELLMELKLQILEV